MTAASRSAPAGELLREWRQRRRMTQLDLALAANISAKHVSFVETGRARPSSEMVLHLCEQLDVPLRDRNDVLLAAGFAPAYGEGTLHDASRSLVGDAVRAILDAHDPYPAVAVDRHWDLVDGNRAVGVLMAGCADHLLEPPVNVLRLSLHPEGLAPRIVNLAQWRAHLLERLDHQIRSTCDRVLVGLRAELVDYPVPMSGPVDRSYQLVVPLQVRTDEGVLAFISTTTVFGTPLDVTVSELAIESFYPADAATAQALRGAAALPDR